MRPFVSATTMMMMGLVFVAASLLLGQQQSPFIEAAVSVPTLPLSPPSLVTVGGRSAHSIAGAVSGKHPWGLFSLARNPSYRSALESRGGAADDNDDDGEEEEEESDDDEEDDDGFLQNFQEPENSDDFKEESTMDRMIGHYVKTPPLTKAYLTASCVLTLLGYVSNGNQFPTFLTLDWNKTFKRLQIWRPLTTFLSFGGFGLGYALTLQFVWQYWSEMERKSHNKPYDFWIMVLFGMVTMLVGYSITSLDVRFLGHNLSTFMVYVWSRTHEGMLVNMFGLFNTRAELLPWLFIVQVSSVSAVRFFPYV
jgi:lipid-A-disaccharide synthase-like uncharacterized protein